MSWLDDFMGTHQPPIATWSWWSAAHRKVAAEIAAPGTPFCAAAAVGTLGRLPTTEPRRSATNLLARIQRGELGLSPARAALLAWLGEQDAAFWAEVDADAELAIEALDGRIESLDDAYDPFDHTWRRLFAQALRARDELAGVAWAAVSAGQAAPWRTILAQVDARGQRLMDGALDLEPIEDDVLATLGAADAAWWLAPEGVTVAAQAPTRAKVIPFARLPRPRWEAPVVAMAADGGDTSGDEGTFIGVLAGVTLDRLDDAGGHLLRLSAPVDAAFDLNEDGVVTVRLADGTLARLEQHARFPLLWEARLLEHEPVTITVNGESLHLETDA